MKHVLVLTALLAGCAAPPAAPVSVAAELLAADRDFAGVAAQQGVHAAFTSVMAEDGIVFRPDAVIAQAWLAEHPDWASPLAWEPDRAEVAGSADVGFTSGTWTLPASTPDGLRQSGRYVTVWRRVRDRWEAVLDHGVLLPEAAFARRSLRVSAPLHATSVGEEATPAQAVRLDMLFAAALGEGGDALDTLLAPDVEFLRDGQTASGRGAAAGAFAPLDAAATGCEGAVISTDGTLSATWGKASSPDGEFTYVRVWRAAHPGELPQLVLDLLAPLEVSG